jgi:hypothetical protein
VRFLFGFYGGAHGWEDLLICDSIRKSSLASQKTRKNCQASFCTDISLKNFYENAFCLFANIGWTLSRRWLQGRLDRRFSGVGTKAAELSAHIEQNRCAPGIKFASVCA